MNNENSQSPRRIGHLIAAFAAGMAMLVAVLLTLFAETLFPKNSSLWILIVVISYILKDRIKEITRNSFGKRLPRLTTDQQTILFDPAGKIRAGRATGVVRFGSSFSPPSRIQRLRFHRPNPFRKILPPNDMIHYKRVVKLKSSLLKKNHSRLESVTEILRFQTDDWLKDMDDTNESFTRLVEGKRLKIKGNRVYRVHLVTSLSKHSDKKSEKLYHYRIIFNKSGILRIEKSDD